MSYLHHVVFSLLCNSCSHWSSGLPLAALVMRVSFSRGVKTIGSIRSFRCCASSLLDSNGLAPSCRSGRTSLKGSEEMTIDKGSLGYGNLSVQP